MTYSADRNALQNYLETGSLVLDAQSDSVVILYKLLLQLSEVLTNVINVTGNVNSLNASKATAANQTTMINRLTELDNGVDALVEDLSSIDSNTDLIVTQLQTGAIKQVVDDLLEELRNGDIKLNSDVLSDQLTQVLTSLGLLTNKLYGLHPTDGINGVILSLLTDIRDKLVVELVDKPTELRLILTDQILVSSPTIRAVPLDTANVQYSVVLPAGTRRFSIKSRLDINDPDGIIRYAYVNNIVANSITVGDDTYYTVGQYVEDEEDNLVLTSPLPIYFASSTPGVVAVVKYWGPAPVQTSSPRSTPHLRQITLVNIDSEYTVQLPATTKKFTVKSRDNLGDSVGIIRAAFVSGVVGLGAIVDGNSYTTIQQGNELQEANLFLTEPLNLYLASDTAGLPVTIEYWS